MPPALALYAHDRNMYLGVYHVVSDDFQMTVDHGLDGRRQ